MTSLFGFAGEIDFTYGAIDKSDETKWGLLKLNLYFCTVNKANTNNLYVIILTNKKEL